MKYALIRLIISLITMCFYDCCGYFYQIHCKRKEVSPGVFQFVIGLGDYHDKNHPSNATQREYFEGLLKRFSPSSIKVIVEDLSSVNSDGRLMCCNYAIKSYGGVLGNLADTVRRMNVDVDNVEYRYCRVASLGPLLMNVHKKVDMPRSSSVIMLRDVRDEIVREIKKVNAYNDGTYLNTLYKEVIVSVERALGQLELGKYEYNPVTDYFKTVSKKKYVQELEKLCVFDSPLLDMHMMHSIARSQDKKIIFVVAGGSHVEKVCNYLTHMGYENVAIAGDNAAVYSLLKNTLGSGQQIKKAVVRPEPVDLKVLDVFINTAY